MLRSISSEDAMTKERTLAAKLKRGDTAALKEIMDCYTGYVRTVIRAARTVSFRCGSTGKVLTRRLGSVRIFPR